MKPGRAYRADFSARTDGKTGGQFKIVSVPAGEKAWSKQSKYLKRLELTDADWKTYSFEFDVPRIEDRWFYLILQPNTFRKAGQWVEFDDITMTPLPPKSPKPARKPKFATPKPGNLLHNGGFEFGLARAVDGFSNLSISGVDSRKVLNSTLDDLLPLAKNLNRFNNDPVAYFSRNGTKDKYDVIILNPGEPDS